MREAWAHTSSLHGGLLKYPIFRDISEIKRMRKQCVPGVLSLLPSERLGTRLGCDVITDINVIILTHSHKGGGGGGGGGTLY